MGSTGKKKFVLLCLGEFEGWKAFSLSNELYLAKWKESWSEMNTPLTKILSVALPRTSWTCSFRGCYLKELSAPLNIREQKTKTRRKKEEEEKNSKIKQAKQKNKAKSEQKSLLRRKFGKEICSFFFSFFCSLGIAPWELRLLHTHRPVWSHCLYLMLKHPPPGRCSSLRQRCIFLQTTISMHFNSKAEFRLNSNVRRLCAVRF